MTVRVRLSVARALLAQPARSSPPVLQKPRDPTTVSPDLPAAGHSRATSGPHEEHSRGREFGTGFQGERDSALSTHVAMWIGAEQAGFWGWQPSADLPIPSPAF